MCFVNELTEIFLPVSPNSQHRNKNNSDQHTKSSGKINLTGFKFSDDFLNNKKKTIKLSTKIIYKSGRLNDARQY